MLIRAGFEIRIAAGCDLPLLLALSPHPDAPRPAYGSPHVVTRPHTRSASYRDVYGNLIDRITAPRGELVLLSDFVVEHDGAPDPDPLDAVEHPVEDLPAGALAFLLPSRYVESDLLAAEADRLFGALPPGAPRVQAICDHVHRHLRFGHAPGWPGRTALEAYRRGRGTCRDFAHLAIGFCRALNIPARYASGYLADIGLPPGGPLDFSAWFETYLGDRWWSFDPRSNVPRVGRILMVRGRDAADAAMITSFGPHALTHFEIWAEELPADLSPHAIEAMLRPPAPRLAAVN